MARTQAALGGLLAGIAVGGLVGWFFAELGSPAESGGPPSLVSSDPGAQRERPAVARHDDGSALAQSARSVLQRPDVAVAAPAIVADADVALHLTDAAAPRAPLPTGAIGVLRGTVRTNEGTPLPGVIVIASRRLADEPRATHDIGAPPPDPKDESDAVRRALERSRQRAFDEHRATTQADGSYAIGLPDHGAYSTSAYLVGYEFDRIGSSRATIGDRIDFRGEAVHALVVHVLGTDGAPVDTAQLEVRRPSGRSNRRGSVYAWSAADPILRLLAGTHEVRALDARLDVPAPDRGVVSQLASPWATISIGTSWRSEELSLRLAPQACIIGRVLPAEDGTSGGELVARLHEQLSLDAIDEEQVRERGTRVDVEAGKFAFPELEPGRYVVGISRGRRGVFVAMEEVVVADAPVELELRIDALDRTRALAVTAHASDGRRLTDLDYELHWQSDGDSRSFGPEELNDLDGTTLLLFEEDYWDGGAGKEYSLEVHSREFGSRVVELSPGQSRADILFSESARLRLHVLSYPGSSYVGRVYVDLSRSEPATVDRSNSRSRMPDNDGVAYFEGLVPGEYRVNLRVAPEGGDRWDSKLVAEREIELSSGENSSDLGLPPLYDLTVIWAEATEEAYCMATKLQGNQRPPSMRGGWRDGLASWKAFDDSGRAEFTDLPAGRYVLKVTDQQRPMEIEVPCGEVVFQPSQPVGYRVVVGGDKELAGEGLREGDLVVGISGQRFSAGERIWTQLSNAASSHDAQVSLLVERGAQRIEVSLTGAELQWNMSQDVFSEVTD